MITARVLGLCDKPTHYRSRHAVLRFRNTIPAFADILFRLPMLGCALDVDADRSTKLFDQSAAVHRPGPSLSIAWQLLNMSVDKFSFAMPRAR